MLKILPECQDADIVRSRDEAVLGECDIVVDVGAAYDPERHRYDHHQRSFADTMHTLSAGGKPWVTKLSSAGLVFHHFGRDVIQACGELDEDKRETLFDRLYESFVEEVDAVDNGVSQFDGTPRYQVNSTLGARVARLNPAWNEPAAEETERFQQALALVSGEFTEALRRLRQGWLPARAVVERAVTERSKVDASGLIMELPAGGVPWKEHLFALEQQHDCQLLFVIYTDQSGNWRVQTVPPHKASFEMRVPLKKAWRGLRDQQLSKEADIEGCVFVHANGFIGGATSREAVLKMARQSLQEAGKL